MARPVLAGGGTDEDEREADDVEEREEDDEDETGGLPELSCLITSAARSACDTRQRRGDWGSDIGVDAHQTVKHRHEMRRDLERQDRPIDHAQTVDAIHLVSGVDHTS